MDPLVKEEIDRLNSETVIGDFEFDIVKEIDDWLLDQENWMVKYGSYKNAVEAFWENRLK